MALMEKHGPVTSVYQSHYQVHPPMTHACGGLRAGEVGPQIQSICPLDLEAEHAVERHHLVPIGTHRNPHLAAWSSLITGGDAQPKGSSKTPLV